MVLETVGRAAGAQLGSNAGDLQLGRDSLSALTFANLLHNIFGVDVPVGVIVGPPTDLQGLATYIDAERQNSSGRTAFASVQGRDATEAPACDLTLDAFIATATRAARPAPRGRSAPLIFLMRAKDDAAARERLDRTFDSGDPVLWEHYRSLAADHLVVIAGASKRKSRCAGHSLRPIISAPRCRTRRSGPTGTFRISRHG